MQKQKESELPEKASKPKKMDDEVKRKQAPDTVDRVCKGNNQHEKDHIHLKGKGKNNYALNKDGTWKHKSRPLTRKEERWLTGHGWKLPK